MPSMIVYGTPSRMDRGLPCLYLHWVPAQQWELYLDKLNRSFVPAIQGIKLCKCACSGSAQPVLSLCKDCSAAIWIL